MIVACVWPGSSLWLWVQPGLRSGSRTPG